MKRVYFCYAFDCVVSQMFVERLTLLIKRSTGTQLSAAFRNIDIRHIGSDDVGVFLNEHIEKMVEESNIFVVFLSHHSFKGDKLRPYIQNELNTLGKIFEKIVYLPIFIEPLTENQKEIFYNTILEHINDLTHQVWVSNKLHEALHLKIDENFTDEKFHDSVQMLFYKIIDCLVIPFHTPFHLKDFYLINYNSFLNDIFVKFNGGIYFETKHTSADYAKILKRAVKLSHGKFFATLRERWFVDFFAQSSIATPNFEYLEFVNEYVKKYATFSADKNKAVRLIIGSSDSYKELFEKVKSPEKIDNFLKLTDNLNLYYIKEIELNKMLHKKTDYPIDDFAVIDDEILIKSSKVNNKHNNGTDKDLRDKDSIEIIQTSLINEHSQMSILYNSLQEIIQTEKNIIKIT